MVLALERDEARSRDERGELAPLLEEDELIAAAVERDRRARHARGQVLHVEGEHRAQVLLGDVRRGGHALALLERLALRLGRLAHELRDEDLPQRGAAGPPAEARALEQHVGLLEHARVGLRRAEIRPVKAAVEHEAADALGVLRGVGDGDRRAHRHAEQREALEPQPVDDGLEIGDEHVEREVAHLAIGQATPAAVVRDVPMTPRELLAPVRRQRARRVVLDVREPRPGADQGRPAAVGADGDLGAVGGGAESDVGAERHAGDRVSRDHPRRGRGDSSAGGWPTVARSRRARDKDASAGRGARRDLAG